MLKSIENFWKLLLLSQKLRMCPLSILKIISRKTLFQPDEDNFISMSVT